MFQKVKKNFGFGCMRLPMIGEDVDKNAFCQMIDAFMAYGFNYFDTAHGYLKGKSETALRGNASLPVIPETASFLPTSFPAAFLTARRISFPCSKTSFSAVVLITLTFI